MPRVTIPYKKLSAELWALIFSFVSDHETLLLCRLTCKLFNELINNNIVLIQPDPLACCMSHPALYRTRLMCDPCFLTRGFAQHRCTRTANRYAWIESLGREYVVAAATELHKPDLYRWVARSLPSANEATNKEIRKRLRDLIGSAAMASTTLTADLQNGVKQYIEDVTELFHYLAKNLTGLISDREEDEFKELLDRLDMDSACHVLRWVVEENRADFFVAIIERWTRGGIEALACPFQENSPARHPGFVNELIDDLGVEIMLRPIIWNCMTKANTPFMRDLQKCILRRAYEVCPNLIPLALAKDVNLQDTNLVEFGPRFYFAPSEHGVDMGTMNPTILGTQIGVMDLSSLVALLHQTIRRQGRVWNILHERILRIISDMQFVYFDMVGNGTLDTIRRVAEKIGKVELGQKALHNVFSPKNVAVAPYEEILDDAVEAGVSAVDLLREISKDPYVLMATVAWFYKQPTPMQLVARVIDTCYLPYVLQLLSDNGDPFTESDIEEFCKAVASIDHAVTCECTKCCKFLIVVFLMDMDSCLRSIFVLPELRDGNDEDKVRTCDIQSLYHNVRSRWETERSVKELPISCEAQFMLRMAHFRALVQTKQQTPV
jgi:hypothetical protein